MTRTVTLTELDHIDFFGSEIDLEFRVTIEIDGSEPSYRGRPWADSRTACIVKVEARRFEGGAQWQPLPLALIPLKAQQRIAGEALSDYELAAAE